MSCLLPSLPTLQQTQVGVADVQILQLLNASHAVDILFLNFCQLMGLLPVDL